MNRRARVSILKSLRGAIAELEREGGVLLKADPRTPLHEIHAATLSRWSGDSELYQRILDFTPEVQDGVYRLVRRRRVSLRRHRGTFYTPEPVIQYILDLTLGPLVESARTRDDILQLRILDPAMGGGHFLLAAAKYLVKAVEGEEEQRRLIVENCLYGMDLDAEAVRLARAALAAYCGADEVRPHLHHGDSLRLSLGEVWPEQNGFDAVIGNPPYHSYAGRQRIAGGDELKALFNARGLSGGWASSHSYFMVQCLHWLKPGSRAAMIVPDQVGHLEKYAPLRDALTREACVTDVRYWGDDVFAAARTPALTFCLARERAKSGRLTRRDGSQVEAAFSAAPWHCSPHADLLESLRQTHVCLEGFRDSGVHTGNAAAQLIFTEELQGTVPILEGKQLRPFGCDVPQLWLSPGYDRQPGEYFRIAPPEKYAAYPVLLRQTADRPIAARHVHGCPFRNSILALRLPDGWSVEYALGLLNSNVVAWLYQQLAAESAQKNFPQVKIKMLRRLPLPDPGRAENRALVREVELLACELEAGLSDGRMAVLDAAVLRLYGLEGLPE